MEILKYLKIIISIVLEQIYLHHQEQSSTIQNDQVAYYNK